MVSQKHHFTRAENRRPAAQFLIRFLGLMALYYLLTVLPWTDAYLTMPVLKFCADATSWMLNQFGASTGSEGVVVHGATYAIAVRRGCDPVDPIALFVVGVLAFPASSRGRLVGLLFGPAALFGVNLLRLCSLYILGEARSSWFEILHE